MSVDGSRSPPSASSPSGSARAGSGNAKRQGGSAAGGGVGAIATSITTPAYLLGGHAQDFLEGGDPVQDLAQACLAQREHAEVAGDLPERVVRGAGRDQLADLAGDRQHLVEGDAALETGEGAGRAPAAALEDEGPAALRAQAVLDQPALIGLVGLAAVLADLASQPLG